MGSGTTSNFCGYPIVQTRLGLAGDIFSATELPILLQFEEAKFSFGVEGGHSTPDGPNPVELREI